MVPDSRREEQPLQVLVVGAGAIGGFYGARLAQAGAQVSVVVRSDFDIIRREGFHFDSIDGDFTFRPEAVYGSPVECPTPPDLLIIATKALPEIDLIGLIRPVVGENTTLLLIQNGIHIEAPIAEAFPDNTLISGLAFICVNKTAPGRIRHLCFGRLAIGRYPQGNAPMTERLARLFESVNVPCSITDDVMEARWRKLVWNAPFNPISVLAGGVTTREMLSTPESISVIRAVMEEVLAIAAADGYPLEKELVQKNIDDTHAMEPYKTSMLLDYESGRTMEVEAILGNALRLADHYELKAPHLRTLHALLSLAAR
ncbi:MAG: 2-dehydropantoate 2-reductase [Magnetococcales bacterium]|nr:2-dehydropantoate 2-reductase [Magnetococcales bacterium]